MSLFEDFTDEELLQVLACKKIQTLGESLDDSKTNTLLLYLNKTLQYKPKQYKRIASMISPWTEALSYPMMALWTFFSVVNLSALAFLFGIVTVLCLTLILAGFMFYSNYNEALKKEIKINQSINLIRLKIKISDEYLERHGLIVDDIKLPQYKSPAKLQLVKHAMYTALVVSATLFGTHFLGLTAILSSLGVAGLTVGLGPLALFLGLVASLALGVYFGYQHYKHLEEEHFFKFIQKKWSNLLEKKAERCHLVREHSSSVIISACHSEQRMSQSSVINLALRRTEPTITKFKKTESLPTFFNINPENDPLDELLPLANSM